MARKDLRNKKADVPVGGDLSESLTDEDIAEREAEALKDAGIDTETEDEDDEPAEPVKRPGLFRREPQTEPDPIDDDIFDDYSIEEEMLAVEKSEIQEERDSGLPAIIAFAQKHAELAKKNNWSGIASAYNSLAAVAQQTQANAQKQYWTKRVKV